MHTLAIVGQILFGGYWFYSGIGHFMFLAPMTGYATSKNVPAPKLAVVVSGLLLLSGGAGILLGVYVWWAILALIIFIVPVTFKMHAFWTISDPQTRMIEQVNFAKNLALLGALLLLWSLPTLGYSLFAWPNAVM